jgi:hypothetical protein
MYYTANEEDVLALLIHRSLIGDSESGGDCEETGGVGLLDYESDYDGHGSQVDSRESYCDNMRADQSSFQVQLQMHAAMDTDLPR